MAQYKIKKLRSEVYNELVDHILPYWTKKMVDPQKGGFFGRITGDEQVIREADKGGILNARILWTFSCAYRSIKNPVYLEMATRSFNYNISHFFDEEFDGTFWLLDSDGKIKDPKKQIYSLAFFIYAFAEYYRASGNIESLDRAIELYSLIEKYSFDPVKNGYFEAFSREWGVLENLRLSDKDANEKKTMNTHLHVLEAYTNLYRVWKDERLKQQLKNLLEIFLDIITDQHSFHLRLFFDENWTCKSDIVSYGHDIEASWLLMEAAEILEETELTIRTRDLSLKIARAATEGLQPDGSLIYELDRSSGHQDSDRHWWPQAEAVVGYFHAYRLSGDASFLEKSIGCWEFIKNHLVDNVNGEWFWSISSDGTINKMDDKAGFWKCPYHNARMCLEIINASEDPAIR